MTRKPKPTAPSKQTPPPEKKPVRVVIARKAMTPALKAHSAPAKAAVPSASSKAVPTPTKAAGPASKKGAPAAAPTGPAVKIDAKTAAKLLAEKDRKGNVEDIKEESFPPPADVPPIPESNDGAKLELPPDDVPTNSAVPGK